MARNGTAYLAEKVSKNQPLGPSCLWLVPERPLDFPGNQPIIRELLPQPWAGSGSRSGGEGLGRELSEGVVQDMDGWEEVAAAVSPGNQTGSSQPGGVCGAGWPLCM